MPDHQLRSRGGETGHHPENILSDRERTETVVDDESRLQFGTRVLYKLGFVDLRGYVKWYGVFDDLEAWDAGGGVQLHF